MLITIVLSFSLPKFFDITKNTDIIKLKSQYSLIQNALSDYKTKQILLANQDDIEKLDDAMNNKEDEKLFDKILKLKILSTNNTVKKSGLWIKKDDKNYSFVLDNTIVKFTLEKNIFKCVEPTDICQGIY